ncbi:BppU family phage baseplate upper protein [Staphylococcus gallinarum]|uniref:BppU family phage baseplate upper protein n=1 Tax=Staphylococcus gallinarum TaxID=1293 RepID=UPI001E3A2C9B|nr:BppU family phage baseplate upper protein [Staphylococcus gallinarum]UEH02003.1 BppU family phage baseplate upper protein [Staphylococcus gallinarum]
MTNGIDKRALFKLASEPYLKPISDLGVGFYNLDENTTILRFQLTNNKGPLLISNENLTAYAYFESTNGSASDVIELNIEDEFKGIVTITLDSAFLHACTNTTVKGQVYIGVNNVVGDPQYNEVAVLNEFQFEVADALINKITSTTKIEYIRMFSQLKMKIEQQVKDIENAIANGADYVAEMKSILQQGKDALNKIVVDGKADIDAKVVQAKNDIGLVGTNTVNTITQTRDEILKAIEDKKIVSSTDLETKLSSLTWQKAKLTNDAGILDSYSGLDFNSPETMLGSKTTFGYASTSKNYPGIQSTGFFKYYVRTANYAKMEYRPFNTNKVYERTKNNGVWNDWTELITDIATLPVQQYRLTNNDGSYQVIALGSNLDSLHGLAPGNYYTTSTPITGASSTAGFTVIEQRSDVTTKRITFRPYNSSEVWVKRYYQTWADWERIDGGIADTGWIPFEMINGVQSNTAYKSTGDNGFDCAYRTTVNGSVVNRYLRINGTNLTPGQTIANLPSNFCKNAQTFPIRIPTKYAGGYVVIRPSGEVKFYINGDASAWTTTDYAYGEITWID